MDFKNWVNRLDEIATKFGGRDRRRYFTSLLHSFADTVREEDARICESFNDHYPAPIHLKYSEGQCALSDCAEDIRAQKGGA